MLELVRSELAAMRAEIQTTLTETAAMLSTRVRTELEQRMGEPSALVAGIQGVRDGLAARDVDLSHMLRRVVDTCDALAERVQLDKIERTALLDAVSRLTTAVAVAGTFALPQPGRETVIGGTVEPDRRPDEIDLEAEAAKVAEPIAAPATVLDAPAPLPVPDGQARLDGVEVRCRFGDRWVAGFEVCEVIRLDDVTRYRMRRRSDGSVLPTLFDEKDLRFFSTTFVER